MFNLFADSDDGETTTPRRRSGEYDWHQKEGEICEHRKFRFRSNLEYNQYFTSTEQWPEDISMSHLRSLRINFTSELHAPEILSSIHFDSAELCGKQLRICPLRNKSSYREINAMALQSLEFTADFATLWLDYQSIVEKVRNVAGVLRRRIVHDVYNFGDATVNAICCEVANLASKRSFVLAFFHGEERDLIGAFDEQAGRSGFYFCGRKLGRTTCMARDDERDVGSNQGSQTRLVGNVSMPAFGECSREPTEGGSIGLTSSEEDEKEKGDIGRKRQRGIRKRDIDIGGELFGCGESTRPHFHVIHDCAWHAQTCRCHRLNSGKRLKSFNCQGQEEEAFDYIISLLEYSNKGKRTNIFLQIGTSSEAWPSTSWFPAGKGRIGNTNQDLECQRLFKIRCTRALESKFPKYDNSDKPETGTVRELREISKRARESHERQGSRRKTLPGAIVSFCKLYPTFPINAIYQTRHWLRSDFKYLLPSDSVFERAMLNLQVETSNFNLDDFLEMYRNSMPEFAAVQTPYKEYYYDVYTSFVILKRLVLFQLNSEFEETDTQDAILKDFFTKIYNVVERKIPKCNTIYVTSPPSAGKNYLFDAISSFYLNVGNIANFNKGNNFPFQDATLRRINVWNEPNFMPSAVDTIKMLTAGDMMHVNVKHKSHVPLYRTPLFVLSNVHVFQDKAFKDRMIRYQWNSAPFLKLFTKKPSPLVWVYILNEYNIHDIDSNVYDEIMKGNLHYISSSSDDDSD